MTVNEMIAELERERAAGHGEKEVRIYVDAEGLTYEPTTREVQSILYISMRSYAHNIVEIV